MVMAVTAGAVGSIIIVMSSYSTMRLKTDVSTPERDEENDEDDDDDHDEEGNEEDMRGLCVCGLDREHVKEIARSLRDDAQDGVRMSKAWRDAAVLLRFVNADLLSSLRYVEATLRYWRRVERQPLRRRRRTMVFGRGMLYCMHRLIDAVSMKRRNRFWSDEDEMLVLRVRTIRAVRRALLQALAIVHSAAASMRSAGEHRGRNGDAVMCTALTCAALRINDAMEAVRGLSSNASAVMIQRDTRRSARAQVRRIGEDIDEVWARQRHRETKLRAAMGSLGDSTSDVTRGKTPSVQDVREALRLAWCTYERRTADTQIGAPRRGLTPPRGHRFLTGTIITGSRYGPLPSSSSSSAALASRSLVQLPQWCREPSYLQRHWIRVSLLVLLATKSIIVVTRNYEAIRDAYKSAVELASTRLVENVYEPLKFMHEYIFGRRGSPEAGGASTKSVSYDDEYRKELQILDAMLEDFVSLAQNQNKQASLVSMIPQSKPAPSSSTDSRYAENSGDGIDAASLPPASPPSTPTTTPMTPAPVVTKSIGSKAPTTPTMTSSPVSPDTAASSQPHKNGVDRVEALNLVNTTFQRESVAPVSNMMRGLLSNSLLISIQKMKCDSIAMLMSIDDVMQKNELTMIGMAAAPAVSFLYALLLLVSRATRRRPVDLTEEVFRAKMALAKIDRHLLRVKVGVAGASDIGVTASRLRSHVRDADNENGGEDDEVNGGGNGDDDFDDDINAYSIDESFGSGSRSTTTPFASQSTSTTSLEETGTCIFLTCEVYREVFELYARSGSGSGRGSVYRVREIVTDGPQSDYAKSASSVNPLEFLEMRKYLALLSWPGVAVEDKLRIVESIRTSFDIFR